MRRIFAMLLVLTLMLTAVVCMSLGVSAESMYIRKIVSVVYDDSTSMDFDKWAYASYAMQAFCGMLNSEDQLYITYMSRSDDRGYSPEKIDLSANGIQASVDTIRNHPDSGATPYSAVELAYDKLTRVQDSNPNTQYWLVVITDGGFNDFSSYSPEKNCEILNDNFEQYASSVMPNGTNPQITFLAIGDYVYSPDENEQAGIYTYTASNANDITNAMHTMADRISGRTRLDRSDLKQLDSRTIQVSSAMPLTNIVVFAQQSEARIETAICNNETDIPISREASLKFGTYKDLVGGAYMLGDANGNIGAGTYKITFSEDVSLDNVVVLFEPALEMRTVVTVNGKEISDIDELENATEGDIVSISCKIYEMGTENEIASSVMPSGTTFEIVIKEDNVEAAKTTKNDMTLSDYTLKNMETVISASVAIEGFNPIDFVKKFTPHAYVPTITMTSEFGGVGAKSIKLDNLATNKEMTVCFTLYSDGEVITDKALVNSLNPQISTSLAGNDGSVEIADDGRIIFTPNTAKVPSEDEGSYDIEVTCTVDTAKGEVSASNTYTVLTADFAVVALPVTGSVKKNEFFGNTVGASFNITRDGVPLGKSVIENQISVTVNEKYANLPLSVSVSEDGTISIVPCAAEERKLTVFKWLGNWWYYFGLPGEDLTVTLNHKYGTASAVIDVTEASLMYQILNVYTPLAVCILMISLFIAYWVRFFKKPRFAKSGVLYVGTLDRMKNGNHCLTLSEKPLDVYNSVFNSNNKQKWATFCGLFWPFSELTVSVDGISITAEQGDNIKCNAGFPWYVSGISPARGSTIRLNSPKAIVEYCIEKDAWTIGEIRPSVVNDEQNSIISQDDSVYYFVNADVDYVKQGSGQREVIKSATVFCYSAKE